MYEHRCEYSTLGSDAHSNSLLVLVLAPKMHPILEKGPGLVLVLAASFKLELSRSSGNWLPSDEEQVLRARTWFGEQYRPPYFSLLSVVCVRPEYDIFNLFFLEFSRCNFFSFNLATKFIRVGYKKCAIFMIMNNFDNLIPSNTKFLLKSTKQNINKGTE